VQFQGVFIDSGEGSSAVSTTSNTCREHIMHSNHQIESRRGRGRGRGREGEDVANEELGKGIWRRGTWICHHYCRSTCRSGGGGGLTASPGESLLLSPGVCDGG